MDPLTISYRDWNDLTSRVAMFASPDGALPLLASVRVFERGGRLMAEATDRYTIAFAAAPSSVVAPEGFSVLLRTEALTQLGHALGVTARNRAMVSLTLQPSDDGATVKIAAGGGLPLGDMTMTVPLVVGNYPAIHRLVDEARARDVTPAPAFASWVLAKIGRAATDRVTIAMEQHGEKPAYFAAEDESIAGLVVPVKGGMISHALLDLYVPVVTADTEAVAS